LKAMPVQGLHASSVLQMVPQGVLNVVRKHKPCTCEQVAAHEHDARQLHHHERCRRNKAVLRRYPEHSESTQSLGEEQKHSKRSPSFALLTTIQEDERYA